MKVCKPDLLCDFKGSTLCNTAIERQKLSWKLPLCLSSMHFYNWFINCHNIKQTQLQNTEQTGHAACTEHLLQQATV